MAEGFKLLDAYVEISAKDIGVKGVADKAAKAVESAADRVQAARKREEDTAGQLRLAELRLADLRKTEVAGSTRLIAAEERFAAAQRSSAAAVANTARAVGGLNDSMRRTEPEVKRAGSDIGSSLIGGFKGFAQGAIAGVVAGITAPLVQGVGRAIEAVTMTAKTAIFDYNSKLEQANIGFTTMLGSADKAKSFLGDLQKFAASTPFEFQDLTLASQRLIAMGVNAKDVIPYMTGIGDAVAGLGGGTELVNQVTTAIGQMVSKGVVQGDELLQLNEAGIPALKILASAYGVSTAEISKMVSAGKILAKDAVPAIISGLEKGTKTTASFGGMMDKQSKTMTGAMSNISDSINQTVSKAFLPLFTSVEKVTKRIADFAGSKAVTKWANDTAKSVDKFMTMIGDAINEVFADPAVKRAIGDLGTSIQSVFKKIGPALREALPNLIQFAKDVLPSLIGAVQGVIDKIPTLIRWWVRLSAGLKAVGPFVGGLIGWLSDLSGTIFNISATIGNFVADVVSAFVNLTAQSQKPVLEFIDWLTGAGGNMVTAVVNGILGRGNPIAQALSGLVAQAGAAVSKQVAALQYAASHTGVSTAIGDTQDAKKALAGSMANVRAASVAAATAASAAVGGGVAGTLSAGGGSVGGGGGGSKPPSLASIFKVFQTYGKQVAAGLKSGLLGSVDQIKTAAGAMRDAVKKAFDNDYLSKGGENRMLAEITKVTNKLIAETKRREHTITVLNAANDKLKDLKSDRASLVASVRDGIMGEGDINSIFEAATSTTTSSTAASGSLDGRSYQASYSTSTTTTSGGITGVRAKLRTLLANTKAFTTNLKQLVKNGLDRFTVQELFAAGATAGLPITRELLADKSAFNDIVSLQKQLASAAGVLGEFAGGTTYDASIGSATANVNRLRDKRDNITAVMIVEARKIDEVDKVVKAVNALAKTAKAKKAGAKK